MKLGPIQEKWLQSLEQNPERQMELALGEKQPDGSYKACCLGELGLIAGVCEWNGQALTVVGRPTQRDVLKEVYTDVGLHSHDGLIVGNVTFTSLAGMNDRGSTWPEIAAFIRANPEKVFTHAV